MYFKKYIVLSRETKAKAKQTRKGESFSSLRGGSCSKVTGKEKRQGSIKISTCTNENAAQPSLTAPNPRPFPNFLIVFSKSPFTTNSSNNLLKFPVIQSTLQKLLFKFDWLPQVLYKDSLCPLFIAVDPFFFFQHTTFFHFKNTHRHTQTNTYTNKQLLLPFNFSLQPFFLSPIKSLSFFLSFWDLTV